MGSIPTKQKRLAARLLATTSLTHDEIADKISVQPRTVKKWLSEPEFQEMIADANTEDMAEAKRSPLARKADRIRYYSRVLRLLEEVVTVRSGMAKSEEDIAAGMATGLVMRRHKSIGTGETAYSITEYETDPLPAELGLKYTKQLAQELGDWDAHSADGGGGPIIVTFGERSDGPGSDGDDFGHNLYALRDQAEAEDDED